MGHEGQRDRDKLRGNTASQMAPESLAAGVAFDFSPTNVVSEPGHEIYGVSRPGQRI